MKNHNFYSHLAISLIVFIVSFGAAKSLCSADIAGNIYETSPIDISSTGNSNLAQLRNKSVAGIRALTSVLPISNEQLVPNDPYVWKQWALKQIEVPSLWQLTTGNSDTLIAILDTGIDANHEDLSGKIIADINFTDSPTSGDINGHGTHVTGIAAAIVNNNKGIAGIAPTSSLMNVKVANDYGMCQATTVARGVVWAVDNGASVVNISLEIKESSPELEEAIEYAWRHGALVVAAAGNEGSQSPTFPAYYENSVAVAATEERNMLAPLSNHGDWVDVAAPGFHIYSTLPNNDYGYKSGTSCAAAHVSGLAALIFSKVTDTNGNGRINDEVREVVEGSCRDIGVSGVGKGQVHAAISLPVNYIVEAQTHP